MNALCQNVCIFLIANPKMIFYPDSLWLSILVNAMVFLNCCFFINFFIDCQETIKLPGDP